MIFIAIGGLFGLILILAVSGSIIDDHNQAKVRTERAIAEKEARAKAEARERQERDAFLGAIETHYQELLRLTSERNSDAGMVAALFEKYDRTDYKDAASLVTLSTTIGIKEQLGEITAASLSQNSIEELGAKKALLETLSELEPNDPTNEEMRRIVVEALDNARIAHLKVSLAEADPDDLSSQVSILEKLISFPGQEATFSEQLQHARDERAAQIERDKEDRLRKKERERVRLEQEKRQNRLESAFSAWDGSHRGLEKYIKRHLNDPKSYEHVQTSYSDKGDYLVVRTEYRAKNGFGGLVLNSMTAKADLDGNVLEIVSTEP